MTPSARNVVSAGVGAALTACVFLAVPEGRGSPARDAESEDPVAPADVGAIEPGTPAPLDPVNLHAENARLRQRVAELEARVPINGAPPPPSAGTREAFEAEPRDPDWAPAQERVIARKLERFLGVANAAVECRTACCEMSFAKEGAPVELWRELESSVGFRDGSTTRTRSTIEDPSGKHLNAVRFCFDRSADLTGLPDRALERDQLLARAVPALRQCALQAAVPFVLKIDLAIDRHGAISDLTSTADQIPDDAADCAVAAVVDAAAFAPAPIVTMVPITIRLDPTVP